MRHLLQTIAFALLAAWSAAAMSAQETRLKAVQIMDPSGFEKPLVAASSVIPADWTSQGGIVWNLQGECQRGFQMNWNATSPDGKSAISILPTQAWRSNSIGLPIPQDCIPGYFENAEQFVRAFVQQHTDGSVLEVHRDQTVVAALAPLNYEVPGDPHTRSWTDFISAHVAYTENGENMQAVMTMMTLHTHSVSGHSFGAPMQQAYGAALMLTIFSAPEAEFDARLGEFHLFASNYRPGPEWEAKIAAYNLKMSGIAAEGAKDRSKIMSNTYSDISDSSMASWRKRNAMSDTGQRETSEMIREVETYGANTSSGQIDLPFGYDNAWQMPDDTFIVTNDAFFEPADGTRLKPLN